MLTDLISRVSPDVEREVDRVRNVARSVIQDALRAECRLLFRTPEDTRNNRPGAQVPIEIASGYPSVVENMAFPNDFERILLLGRYRAAIEQACACTPGLLQIRNKLLCLPEPENWTSASDADLCSVANWATALLKYLDENDPLKNILSVSEDILGVYEIDERGFLADDLVANRATIRLYWGVIGLFSQWIGCSIEDLTIVVLTHELAHAYTQLGADIEGRRWAVSSFKTAEHGLKEGLAQYYTDRVLRRLEHRFAGALKIFLKLLPGQPDAYRSHQPWLLRSSPEAVRRAMLEVRRWNEGTLEKFNQRLEAAQLGLDPDHGSN